MNIGRKKRKGKKKRGCGLQMLATPAKQPCLRVTYTVSTHTPDREVATSMRRNNGSRNLPSLQRAVVKNKNKIQTGNPSFPKIFFSETRKTVKVKHDVFLIFKKTNNCCSMAFFWSATIRRRINSRYAHSHLNRSMLKWETESAGSVDIDF